MSPDDVRHGAWRTAHVRFMDAIDVESPATAELDRIAEAINGAPGADGRGLDGPTRAALFAFLDTPTDGAWVTLRRTPVTHRHTLWVAVMRHARIGMYRTPSTEQMISTLQACAAGAIRP